MSRYHARPKEEELSTDEQTDMEGAVGPGRALATGSGAGGGGGTDPSLLQFQLRVQRAQDQVVR
eukprot:COSAG01_NODE_1508_length_10054_cov_3.434713_7_plen_64_part_00